MDSLRLVSRITYFHHLSTIFSLSSYSLNWNRFYVSNVKMTIILSLRNKGCKINPRMLHYVFVTIGQMTNHTPHKGCILLTQLYDETHLHHFSSNAGSSLALFIGTYGKCEVWPDIYRRRWRSETAQNRWTIGVEEVKEKTEKCFPQPVALCDV